MSWNERETESWPGFAKDMMRSATLMPSPMILGYPFRSIATRTGPRLMPMRTRAVARGGTQLRGRGGAEAVQLQRHDEALLRVAQEGDRRAVARVEDDAILGRHAAERLGEELVERLLHGDLPVHGLLGIAHQVHADHAADDGSARVFRIHRCCAIPDPGNSARAPCSPATRLPARSVAKAARRHAFFIRGLPGAPRGRPAAPRRASSGPRRPGPCARRGCVPRAPRPRGPASSRRACR
jgi:hypothetical protein